MGKLALGIPAGHSQCNSGLTLLSLQTGMVQCRRCMVGASWGRDDSGALLNRGWPWASCSCCLGPSLIIKKKNKSLKRFFLAVLLA